MADVEKDEKYESVLIGIALFYFTALLVGFGIWGLTQI